MPPEGAEIRVHGVGDHHLLSALSAPTVVRNGTRRGAIIVRPPKGSNHDLFLVNWSRCRAAPRGHSSGIWRSIHSDQCRI